MQLVRIGEEAEDEEGRHASGSSLAGFARLGEEEEEEEGIGTHPKRSQEGWARISDMAAFIVSKTSIM